MTNSTYDIFALAMRFWFVGLIFIILLKMLQAMFVQHNKNSAISKNSTPFSMGLLEIIDTQTPKLLGKRFALKQENRIGSSNKCDILIKSAGIKPIHCVIYQKKKTIMISDNRTAVYLNGIMIDGEVALADRDTITLGTTVMQLNIIRAFRSEIKRDPVYDDSTAALSLYNAPAIDDTQPQYDFGDERDQYYDDNYYPDEEYDDNEEYYDDDEYDEYEEEYDDEEYYDEDEFEDEYDDEYGEELKYTPISTGRTFNDQAKK